MGLSYFVCVIITSMNLFTQCIVTQMNNISLELDYQQRIFPQIMKAIRISEIKDVQSLLQQYPSIVSMQDAKGWTLLMYAVLYNQPEIVKCLVSAGTPLSLRSKEGKTAFQMAQEYPKLEDDEEHDASVALQNAIREGIKDRKRLHQKFQEQKQAAAKYINEIVVPKTNKIDEISQIISEYAYNSPEDLPKQKNIHCNKGYCILM